MTIDTIEKLNTYLAIKNEQNRVKEAADEESRRIKHQAEAEQHLADNRAVTILDNDAPDVVPDRPTDEKIIEVIAMYFHVEESIAYGWLLELSNEIEYL